LVSPNKELGSGQGSTSESNEGNERDKEKFDEFSCLKINATSILKFSGIDEQEGSQNH
jgi:hypothetical protein